MKYEITVFQIIILPLIFISNNIYFITNNAISYNTASKHFWNFILLSKQKTFILFYKQLKVLKKVIFTYYQFLSFTSNKIYSSSVLFFKLSILSLEIQPTRSIYFLETVIFKKTLPNIRKISFVIFNPLFSYIFVRI